MRWHCLVVIGLLMTGGSSWSQESPSADHLGKLTSGAVHFRMIQGRIGLDGPRHQKGSQLIDQPGHYESIRVTAIRGIPTLQYVCRTPVHHLTVRLSPGMNMLLESIFPRSGVRCVLSQPSSGPIEWEIVTGKQSNKFHGCTLIDVRLQDEALFDEHFGYVITRMMQGRALSDFSDRVLEEVITAAANPEALNRDSMGRWIDDLCHRRHYVRANAQHQLVRCGVSALPIIESHLLLDPMSEMDPEQRERLQRIMGRLRSCQVDDARSLAKRLLFDQRFWQTIAGKLSTEERVIAASHLRRQGMDVPDAMTGQPFALIAEALDRK